MQKTYPAVLRGGQIEWTGEVPPTVGSGLPVPVHILFDEQAPVLSDDERVKRRMAAIRVLRHLRTFEKFGDPVAWQREQRKDRPLPGRDE